VRHVFYVFIPPPCPLCPPGNAALQCGMSSTFPSLLRALCVLCAKPSFFFLCALCVLLGTPHFSAACLLRFHLSPCPPCETFFFLSLCPLCPPFETFFSLPPCPLCSLCSLYETFFFPFSVPSVSSLRNLLYACFRVLEKQRAYQTRRPQKVRHAFEEEQTRPSPKGYPTYDPNTAHSPGRALSRAEGLR